MSPRFAPVNAISEYVKIQVGCDINIQFTASDASDSVSGSVGFFGNLSNRLTVRQEMFYSTSLFGIEAASFLAERRPAGVAHLGKADFASGLIGYRRPVFGDLLFSLSCFFGVFVSRWTAGRRVKVQEPSEATVLVYIPLLDRQHVAAIDDLEHNELKMRNAPLIVQCLQWFIFMPSELQGATMVSPSLPDVPGRSYIDHFRVWVTDRVDSAHVVHSDCLCKCTILSRCKCTIERRGTA